LSSYIENGVRAPRIGNFEYRFLNYTPRDDTALHSLTPPSVWLDRVYAHCPPKCDVTLKSAQMIAMDFFAFDHFLKNRTERWLLRACDDTIINFPALPRLLGKLEYAYDPRTVAVIKGDCVRYHGNVYIQGGSGLLCSRRAVELMAPRLDLFISMMALAEDTTIGPFAAALGLFTNRSCSGAFLGHGPNKGFVWAQPRKYPTCPRREMVRFPFPRHMARVRDVVFYHKKDNPGRRLDRAMAKAKLVFGAPENLRWYTKDYFWPVACLGTSELEGNDPII
jgi:hypothetical protein